MQSRNFKNFGNFCKSAILKFFENLCNSDFGNFWKFAIFWEIICISGNVAIFPISSFPQFTPPLPRPGSAMSAKRDKSFWRRWLWRWRWSYMLLGLSEYYSQSKIEATRTFTYDMPPWISGHNTSFSSSFVDAGT